MLLGPERRLVRALAERLMPAEVLAASRSPEALLEGFLGGCGPEQAWAFRGALVFVQWSPWLFQVSVDGGRLPRRFTSLDETGRARLIAKLETAHSYLARSAWRLVKLLIFFSYYEQTAAQQLYGFDAAARKAIAARQRAEGDFDKADRTDRVDRADAGESSP